MEMTAKEREALEHLRKAQAIYLEMDRENYNGEPSESGDFCFHIRSLRRIVMSRIVIRKGLV